eukprot:COSAG04_NODE_19348_length_418_cov_0.905956_1_plen_46_part_01
MGVGATLRAAPAVLTAANACVCACAGPRDDGSWGSRAKDFVICAEA